MRYSRVLRCAVMAASALSAFPTFAQLIGVEQDTGNFYSVSAGTGAIQLIGSSGIVGLGSLEFNPNNGSYYGFTTGDNPVLYRFTVPPTLDQVNSEVIGPLGVAAFEGGLAFSPTGAAFAVNGGVTVPVLLQLNLATGQATPVHTFADRHDFAGLGWRGDGMLIGLDSTDNALYTIDPVTAAVTKIDDVIGTVGTVGGMALNGDLGYFVTGGPLAINPGSNSLYRFDPITGEQFFIASYETRITGVGFAGLTFVPEPSTFALVALMGALLAKARIRSSSTDL